MTLILILQEGAELELISFHVWAVFKRTTCVISCTALAMHEFPHNRKGEMNSQM